MIQVGDLVRCSHAWLRIIATLEDEVTAPYRQIMRVVEVSHVPGKWRKGKLVRPPSQVCIVDVKSGLGEQEVALDSSILRFVSRPGVTRCARRKDLRGAR